MRQTIAELVRERARFIKVPAVVGSLIIGAGVLATYAFSDYLSQRSSDEFQTKTDEQAMIIANKIESRTGELEQILLMLSAYSRLQPNIDKAQWSQFIQQSNILDRHPYILAVGYVDVVTPEQLPSYIGETQKQIPGFAIRPSGDRQIYATIRVIEPEIEVNKRVIGYDMFSEPVRKATMIKARDQGTVAITTPVTLVQDEGTIDKYGVLAYYPLYRQGSDPQTPEQRQKQIIGYAYAAFRPSDLIATIDDSNNEEKSSYVITDSSSGKTIANKLADSSKTVTQYSATDQAKILNQQWVVTLTAYQPAFQRWTAPGVTFLLGIVTSFALGGTIMYLMTRRLMRLENLHQTEIQRTKDELLALTSHQLRTPASGVKQYIGMLLQGFVGELTPQQEAIAKKAFAANERQLETINQLLHVAKADADQLVLQKEPINLVEFTMQIVEEMQDSALEHKSDLQVKVPKKDAIVLADERYLRMVIENLISNALKYSEEGRAVKITITARKDTALVAVRDYGVGISEEDTKKLFKKFTRIPNPLSRSVSGSGLGLFLAEQIMIAHDGDIEVDSKVGKGSIFTITMPTYQQENISARKDNK
jgi:signal transduction histidine kinase